ncbi:MAG: hypothetical protein R3B84_12115 [Zavarzinella sp.]
MDGSIEPARNPMLHPQFQAILYRVFLVITNDCWPVDRSADFYEWRSTPTAFIPPFAFQTRWYGEDTLTEDQEAQLQALQAFGHLRPITIERKNGEQFQETHLVIFDMLPQPKPVLMYHTTPTKHLDSIMASGLKPGRLTKVNTTKFPETHRWIHLFEKREHATERFLLLPDNKGRIPSGNYTLLQVDTKGIDDLFCDPFSVHGFVIQSDAILPHHITVLEELIVA